MRLLSRTIWLLSLVSLCTDIASEMLYPIMPIFLQSIGFSIVLIGVLEGVAEATAGLSKGYFGNWSDTLGRRLPFVQAGYLLSALSKPMMAAFTFPLWIFGARTLDRLGKGVRTGARDALLSEEATPETKGRVFGFHRAMDTTGAFLGPLLALLFLAFYPQQYSLLFLIAFVPGALAIAFTFFIKEKKKPEMAAKKRPKMLDFIRYWKIAPDSYRKVVSALLLFTLFNSSDVFLLLKIKEVTQDDQLVILLYVFYNLCYALLAYPFGALADRWGMRRVLMTGLLVFSTVYLGMSFADQTWHFFALFALYGGYAAATEGVAKAWITNLCEKEQTATAVGTYTAFQSLAAFGASTLAGIIWVQAGAMWVFAMSALVAMLVAFYLSKCQD